MNAAGMQMFGCDVDALVKAHVYGSVDPVGKCLRMSQSILSDVQEILARSNDVEAIERVRQRLNVSKYLQSLADEGRIFGTIDEVPLSVVKEG